MAAPPELGGSLRVRGKYETCPKIDLSLLIQHGVLDESRVEMYGFWSGDVPMVFLYIPGRVYPKREPALLVEFEEDEFVFGQSIAIGFTNTKKGRSPHLICPASGARCNALYLHEHRFISRRAHPDLSDKPSPVHRREVKLMRARDRVLGTPGLAPARGAERSKLIAQLQRIPLLQLRWPQLGPHFEAEDLRRQRFRARASRHSVKKGINNTDFALRRGRRSTGEIDLAAHAMLSPEEWLAQMAPAASELRHQPLAYIEDHPALDVRELVKHWRLDDSDMWAAIIVWPEVGGFLIADLRDPEHAFLRLCELRRRNGDAVPEQIIQMTRSPNNGRWFLKCPVTQHNCELLFRRGNMFLSAQAGRLIHRSQRAG
jgi:hypothetical protein